MMDKKLCDKSSYVTLLTYNSKLANDMNRADVAEWSSVFRKHGHSNASALSYEAKSKPIRLLAIRSSNLLICAISDFIRP